MLNIMSYVDVRRSRTRLEFKYIACEAAHFKDVCACRVLVAEGSDALYVAFMGTKQRRDLLTNANAVLVPLWPASGASGDQRKRQVSDHVAASFRLSITEHCTLFNT